LPLPTAKTQISPTLRRRILLVDDHFDTSNALKALLERRGFEVVTADSMQRALASIDTSRFDLLISDIGLPDGSGWDLMSRVREKVPLKGIALSGFSSDQDHDRSRNSGFSLHIAKPFSFPQLHKAIEELLA